MSDPHRHREGIRIRGTVQGVGFRPAVHRLASALGLGGFIRNDGEGVWIEVEGERDAVRRFVPELRRVLPMPARIESAETAWLEARGEHAFHIASSASAGEHGAMIPPDLAPCEACLRELSDPQDRRYRYPFINCTSCGPRLTIVRSVPYDRPRTTMDAFPLCALCRREYEDPTNRRFHAEPNACPACGPQLKWTARDAWVVGDEALTRAAAALSKGAIVAVKGVGGFLLACDATHEPAVARLRARKRRPDKPFAVMARSLEEARRIGVIGAASEQALTSPARPIVLVPARPDGGLAPSVAPRLTELGIFLAPTPLQHLLVTLGPPVQVMTSGNVADEPIAKNDASALSRIADGFLSHDREINTRADDSVVRIIGGQARALRCGRGRVPDAIALPVRGPAVLAVGGAKKSTICLAYDGQAVVSQHLGDLDHPDALNFFEETIEQLGHLLGIEPRLCAHDLHPDYPSTRFALRSGMPRVAVQHHHAHVASCLAEHGLQGPALGVAFDGTGVGPDGALWGGELLLADLIGFRRLAHLQPIALLGGEAAIREPWRLAVAALAAAGEPVDCVAVEAAPLRRVCALLERRVGCPESTGAGRWFDAVAALCGLRTHTSYEGQAAIELEAAAAPECRGPYEFHLDGTVVELRTMIRAIAADVRLGVPVGEISARFHETLAHAIWAVCRRERGPDLVVLSGGCFQNRRLSERTQALLEQDGFRVLQQCRVPAGDGGLSLGQAAIAMARGGLSCA